MNKTISITVKILVLFLLFISCNPFKQEKEVTKKIKNSKQTIKNIDGAKKRYATSKKQNIDSLHSKTLLQLVGFSYNNKNWSNFHKYRLEHLKIPSLNKYTRTNSLILDYSGAFFWSQNKLDSAYHYYYLAYKSYDVLKDSSRAGDMLINTAIIQKNSRDYIGSESTSFKALPYVESTGNSRKMASVFNNLGIIYMYFDDYENSIKYHTKSYTIRNGLTKNRILELHSLNNIGNVYKEKKQFKKAISYYTKALAKDSILQKYPKIEAMLIDNYAHAQFLREEYKEIPQLFFKALKTRDSINDVPGKVVNYIHLGEYYRKKGNKKAAKKYLEKAKETAETIRYSRDLIEAMEKLTEIYPSTKALNTAKKIIYLQDSIQKVDRRVKDQYSRTRYETLEKEKIILQQKQELQEKELEISRNANTILIIIVFIMFCAVIASIFWYRKYKERLLFNYDFFRYLETKYALKLHQVRCWQEISKGHSDKKIEKILCISKGGLKSKKTALFNKLKAVTKDTDFKKPQAIILFEKERGNYSKELLKSKKQKP